MVVKKTITYMIVEKCLSLTILAHKNKYLTEKMEVIKLKGDKSNPSSEYALKAPEASSEGCVHLVIGED